MIARALLLCLCVKLPMGRLYALPMHRKPAYYWSDSTDTRGYRLAVVLGVTRQFLHTVTKVRPVFRA